jgi:glycosyltransferase involved in cell wall biosynthesis
LSVTPQSSSDGSTEQFRRAQDMPETLRVSIVTPCFNAQALIGDTVASVLGQKAVESGRVGLEYLVCDGASTDGTVDAIRAFQSPHLKLVSETDGGMYEALAKGLASASGDVVAYLNAGDYYHPRAFDVVADMFSASPVSWLTGYNLFYNSRGAVTNAVLPFRYRTPLFACGAYGQMLPFVQQESTFWRRELLRHVDLRRLSGFRYAGDAYLWTEFSRHATLNVVQAALGGFRFHAGQASENKAAYRAELRSFTRRPGPVDVAVAGIDRLLWLMPPQVKKFLNREALFQYDHESGRWR